MLALIRNPFRLLLLFSAPWIFLACSTPSNRYGQQGEQLLLSRSIASLPDAERELAKIDDTYLLGARYLSEFDEMLKDPTKSASALDSDTYARLMAVRMIREESTEQLELARERTVEGLAPEKIRQTIDLRSSTPGLRGLLGRFTGETLRDFKTVGIQSKEWKGLYGKIQKAALAKDWESKLQIPSLENRVHELARSWREYQNSQREPQSESRLPQIQPGAGRSGNVIGTEYPANTWSITYDDGPGTTSTEVVLENLKALGIQATFFQVTNRLLTNTKQAGEVRDAGMELANHSWSHANLGTTSNIHTLDKEIRSSSAEIQKIHGVRPRLFRLPYGSGLNKSLPRSIIAEEGMVHVFWNVDSLDWQDKDASSVARRVMSQVASQKKGVILFHDVHAHTPAASRSVMEQLQKQGARFVTVGQAIEEINKNRQ